MIIPAPQLFLVFTHLRKFDFELFLQVEIFSFSLGFFVVTVQVGHSLPPLRDSGFLLVFLIFVRSLEGLGELHSLLHHLGLVILHVSLFEQLQLRGGDVLAD